MHLTRYYMYERIATLFPEGIRGQILGISGIENFYPLIQTGLSEITEAFYPEVDMQRLSYGDGTFDSVISDQVIEHLADPKLAIQESRRVLKPGGIAIHTTCFMNYIHLFPEDYYRFSPTALRYLCSDFSEILQCEGFGNRILHMLTFLSDRFRSMHIPSGKLSVRRFIATHNEERYPIVTWVVARK